MTSSRKNKRLNICEQTLSTLCLIKNAMLGNFTALMNESQALEVVQSGKFNGFVTPFAFIFAPIDLEVLKPQANETIELFLDGNLVGEIEVNSVFSMREEFCKNIFTAGEVSCEFGKIAISGEFKLFYDEVSKAKALITQTIAEQNAQKITAVMLTADPLNRAHERIIRMSIDKADLVVIFLLQTHAEHCLGFDLRMRTLEHFIKNYLPQNRVALMPLRTTHLFSAHKHPSLEIIAAHQIGAKKLVVGQNHNGIGIFYDHNQVYSIFDEHAKALGMHIVVLPELVYCNECKTLVSTKTCPHGAHHHIKYHPDTIKSLLFSGLVPPAILMRAEISALILSELFPKRFSNIQWLCDELFANSGLLERRTERDFYEELMKLYQTSSLT